jgi:hypothetical protein
MLLTERGTYPHFLRATFPVGDLGQHDMGPLFATIARNYKNFANAARHSAYLYLVNDAAGRSSGQSQHAALSLCVSASQPAHAALAFVSDRL